MNEKKEDAQAFEDITVLSNQKILYKKLEKGERIIYVIFGRIYLSYRPDGHGSIVRVLENRDFEKRKDYSDFKNKVKQYLKAKPS